MKQHRHIGVTTIVAIVLCSTLHAQTLTPYQKEVEDWYTARINELKADDGWLNLVGLYWLSEGKSTFGSAATNKVVFPAGSITPVAGYFLRIGNTIKLAVEPGTDIKIDDAAVTGETIIYQDHIPNLPTVTYGSLQWVVIKRDDKIGIRLRDLKSPMVNSFKGIERFAVDPAWRVPAMLQTPNQPANIYITNVLGQTDALKSPGKLVFTINGKRYSLDVLDQGDDLFIVFGDATSGNTTYPSGRFLYAKKPGADGKTVIDFNEAFNPPCAFTNYATCPLPPKQNILPIAVTAGEKNYGHHM